MIKELTGEETRAILDQTTRVILDQARSILDQITALIEKLSEASGDADKGKVVWPPEAEMSHSDALATCFDFADGELTLSFRSFGNELLTDEDEDAPGGLCVSWQGTQMYEDSPGGCYGVQPLKKLLEDEYKLHVDEGFGDAKTGRLLARLIKAFDEDAP